jgi:eukaryotic-like serine/threonine-protein kinase
VLRTDAGTVVGTVAYMSPEQARGQQVDARTDIWSLGVVLYEMVAGRSPFAGKSSSDVLAAILDREPDPLARFDPDVPTELQRIVTKALRKEREQRYQTTKDLQLDLQALRDELTHRPSSGVEVHSSAASTPSTESAASPMTARSQSSAEYFVNQASNHKLLSTALGLAVLAIGGGVWWTAHGRRLSEPQRIGESELTRLTANPPTRPLTSAQISPDGRYLAYADATGIQAQFLDTGESQRIPDTAGMNVYGWTGDSTKVRASACAAGRCVGWDVSLVGGARRQSGAVWPQGEEVTTNSDGSRLLRVSEDGSQLEVDLLNGTPPKVLTPRRGRHIGAAHFSRDGTRILSVTWGESPPAIESVPLDGGAPTTLFKTDDAGIEDVIELPEHRMIAIVRSGPRESFQTTTSRSAVWEIGTDAVEGATQAPHRLTGWRQDVMLGVSASADGKRLAFLSEAQQSDVYVARFDARTGHMDTPQALTLDEWGDNPASWTPDGSTILMYSERNTTEIFKLRVDTAVEEPLVAGGYPQVTSDGRWVLYEDRGPPVRVMRIPVSGGNAEPVLTSAGQPRCSYRGRCVLEEFVSDAPGFIVFALDPVRGRGALLARIQGRVEGWCILPDGEAGASVFPADSQGRYRIRIESFTGRSAKDIVVQHATGLRNLDPLASGLGFFSSVDDTAGHRALVFIKADGTTEKLWSPAGLSPEWAISSPDGTRLAIRAYSIQRNAWMLTNF